MAGCYECVHEKVCDVWRKQESQDASCFFNDGCGLFQEAVVLCKDCEHSYEDLCGRVCSYGVSVDCVVPEDFYCKDGVRRKTE